MTRLRTFLALAPAERRAFIEAWAWLLASKLSLRLGGLASTVRRWRKSGARSTSGAALPAAVRWMDVAARYCPGGAGCLVRSVATMGLLRRHGLAAELRIGVGATSPQLDAHAWVELDGMPVNDAADVGARFAAFDGPLHGSSARP